MKKTAHLLSAITNCLVPAALVFFTLSCKDHKAKEVFEKPAGERIQQNINSLREKLKSHALGWKVTYQPGKAETGYYQFVFRFINDTEVEMASDFSSKDLALRKSEYSILTGSTVKLSFASGSAIHKLSDSDFSPIPGARGSGLKGDFEFLYYGENEQGDLVFRTNRTNRTILFKKAADNSVDEIKSSYGNLEKFTIGKSVYRSLLESKNGREIRSAFEFPYNARVARIRERITDGNKEYLSNGYITGFGYTATGVFLDSVKRNNGGFVKNLSFTYNENKARFVTNLPDGTELAIAESKDPIIPADGQKYFLNPARTANVGFYYQDSDMGSLTTPDFNALIEKLLPTGATGNFRLFRQSGTKKIDYASFFGTASVNNKNVSQLLIYEDKGDRLVMKPNGFLDANGSIKPANAARYNEFMSFLTDSQGFYVEFLGRATRYTNYVLTFTSVKDPSIRFGVYHFTP